LEEAKKQTARQKSAVRALLVRPVAFHPALARLCGSVTAGLMLSQALYWSERTQDADGWFYKTAAEWAEEICLTRTEQDTARKKLVELGLIETELRGMPAKVYYHVDLDKVCEAISQDAAMPQARLQETCKQGCRKPASKVAGNLQPRMQEASKQACGKPANMDAGITQATPLIAETTAETTADTTSITATIAQAMRPWGMVTAAAAAELFRSCQMRDSSVTAEEIAELIRSKGESINGSVRNPIGLLLTCIPDYMDGALSTARSELRRRVQAEESAARVGESQSGPQIAGRCLNCHRPRWQGSTWITYCCAGCQEDYERRLARHAHISSNLTLEQSEQATA
jgi:hypothetical protein